MGLTQEEVRNYAAATLRALDTALKWPPGKSVALLTGGKLPAEEPTTHRDEPAPDEPEVLRVALLGWGVDVHAKPGVSRQHLAQAQGEIVTSRTLAHSSPDVGHLGQ